MILYNNYKRKPRPMPGQVFNRPGNKSVFRDIKLPEYGFYTILDFLTCHIPATHFIGSPALPYKFLSFCIDHGYRNRSLSGVYVKVIVAHKS